VIACNVKLREGVSESRFTIVAVQAVTLPQRHKHFEINYMPVLSNYNTSLEMKFEGLLASRYSPHFKMKLNCALTTEYRVQLGRDASHFWRFCLAE
jgi:hypothetical protein